VSRSGRPRKPQRAPDPTPWRPVDGILLLDKPGGISSNQALQQARRLFLAEKGGHTGALDPLATGMLPLCFGEATKIAGMLLAGRKAYETVARFGRETDTADADGQVIASAPVPPLHPDALLALLAGFTGRIRQVPPVYSALKQGGEALYLKARRGEAVEVPEREVEVFGIELLELGDDHARLRVECGSGTYIRSLVRDLGRRLGCGAHVEALRRLWVDPFRDAPMHRLEDLAAAREEGPDVLQALLLPLEAGLAGMARLELDPEQGRRLAQGQALDGPPRPPGDYVAFDSQGGALGLVRLDAEGRLRPQRLFRRALRLSGALPGA
jgi:tRNA pseudouridine55 synthase